MVHFLWQAIFSFRQVDKAKKVCVDTIFDILGPSLYDNILNLEKIYLAKKSSLSLCFIHEFLNIYA